MDENWVSMSGACVKIALGTDIIGAPHLEHGTNALELQLLVEKAGFITYGGTCLRDKGRR